MRSASVVLMTACTAPVITATLDFPYCIKGCDFPAGAGDCSFSSYQRCQTSASGRDATCAANPYYNAKAELQPDRSRLPKRRF